MRLRIDEAKAERKTSRKAPRFAPADQSTQMIIGADAPDDGAILRQSASLYARYGLRRVYCSAFSPIPDASRPLPLVKPPLMREHRLYQAETPASPALLTTRGIEAADSGKMRCVLEARDRL